MRSSACRTKIRCSRSTASLTTADAALEVYTKVRDAHRLELALVRRGSPVKLVVLVK